MIYAQDFFTDIIRVLKYCNDYAKELGFREYQIDEDKIFSILQNMREDFPHIDGIENASPFKKAAYFAVHFIAQRPLIDKLPDSIVIHGTRINKIPNHQNVLMAYNIAVDSLHGAIIYRNGDESPITLENPIEISGHSLVDIIDSLSYATPQSHYKILSVLFEQLAYRANPDASYGLQY